MMFKSMISENEKLYDETLSAEKELTSHHYEECDDDKDIYTHSEGYIGAMALNIIDKLELGPTDRFVDLRGGRGIYLNTICDRIDFEEAPILVDNRQDYIDYAKEENSKIQCVCSDSLSFVEAMDGKCDKVLIKEVFDHFDDAKKVVTSLYKKLNDDGIVFIMHKPPQPDMPLFNEAKKKFEEQCSKAEDIATILQEAGYDISRESFAYPQFIPKEYYFKMMEARCISALNDLSDESIEKGIKEMRQMYETEKFFKFDDHFHYLIARKTKM